VYVQVVKPPRASLAVNTTVFVPTGNGDPLVNPLVTVFEVTPQLSVAVGVEKLCATLQLLEFVCSVVVADGQLV